MRIICKQYNMQRISSKIGKIINLEHLFPGSARDQRILQVNPQTVGHYGTESDLLLAACTRLVIYISLCDVSLRF